MRSSKRSSSGSEPEESSGARPARERPAIHIRVLGPDDAREYWNLRLRALREHPEAFTSSYAEESIVPIEVARNRLSSDRPHAFILGAFANDNLIGIIGLEPGRRGKEKHKATLFGMYVAREHTGLGVGAKLISALLERARTAPPLHSIVLTVTAGNGPALALYRSFGFRQFGCEPDAICVDGKYHDKLHLVLQLD